MFRFDRVVDAIIAVNAIGAAMPRVRPYDESKGAVVLTSAMCMADTKSLVEAIMDLGIRRYCEIHDVKNLNDVNNRFRHYSNIKGETQ